MTNILNEISLGPNGDPGTIVTDTKSTKLVISLTQKSHAKNRDGQHASQLAPQLYTRVERKGTARMSTHAQRVLLSETNIRTHALNQYGRSRPIIAKAAVRPSHVWLHETQKIDMQTG